MDTSSFYALLNRFSLLMLLSTLLLPVPLVRAAVLPPPPPETYTAHESSSSYSRRGEFSSSVRKKINALSDDIVKSFPIPVLFGVSVKNIVPDFGDPRDGGARTHEGEDILAPRGALIASPTDAVVTRIGKGGSAGIYVYTANPGGETFRYMHLDAVAPQLAVGTVLSPGDPIGYVGNTGNAAGGPHHLHFEIRDGRKALDPYPRMTREFTTKERIQALTKLISILRKELADR